MKEMAKEFLRYWLGFMHAELGIHKALELIAEPNL